MIKKLNKNNLTIKISEEEEDEKNIQEKNMKNIKEKASNLVENLNLEELSRIHMDEKAFQNNPNLSMLLDYMEGRNKELDMSYAWLNNHSNVLKLSKCIYFSPKSWEAFYETRDFEQEFKLLKLITEDEKHKQNLIQISRTIINGNNRYGDILPFSYNTPLLNNEGSNELTVEDSYINASCLDGGPLEKDKGMFIATQGPLKKTIKKFWKLVLQKGISTIIMLCREIEDLRRKCERYWPETTNTPMILEDLSIILEKETIMYEHLIIRSFKIYKDQKEIREVTQIQIENWPDHLPPINPSLIYFLLDFVDKGKNLGPVIVHCSAGNGRTGCFIALYNIIQCLKLLKEINQELQQTVKPFFSVFNICRKLREQRQGIISSAEQYKFVYEFAAGYSQKLFFN